VSWVKREYLLATTGRGTGRGNGRIQVKYPLQQPGPVLIRRSCLRFLAVHTLLARRRDDRGSQRAVLNSLRSEQGGHAAGTSAANFTKSFNGDNLMPVVPSGHGREEVP
jgi:hypothetical protein